jgi:predicted lipid-binding transport protein (Tim44 family)
MNQFVEILFFALLAGYLVFRLWSVLGRENPDDYERRNKKFLRPDEDEQVDNVIPLHDRHPPRDKNYVDDEFTAGVREGIRQLQSLEPSFQIEAFLKGARRAYQMIIEVFSKGDKKALEELLSPEVFQQFSKAIEDREKNHQEVDVQIESIDKMDIDQINVQENKAHITVRYRSRQIIITKDKQGVVIDNPAEISVPITDIWTFSRTIGAENPNWILTATKTQSYRDM